MLRPYQSLFSSLFLLAIRRPLWPVFLCTSACSGTQRVPLPGVLLCCLASQAYREAPPPHPLPPPPASWVLLCRSVHQALKGAPWVGSCFVVQYVRCLMAQRLYCSAAGCWPVGRERGYGDGSTPSMRLSNIALLPKLPGFPPQASPTMTSDFDSGFWVTIFSKSSLIFWLVQVQRKISWDFPSGPVVQISPCNEGGLGSVPGWGAKTSPLGQNTETLNRSNIVTNSIKTLKMVHIKNIKKNTCIYRDTEKNQNLLIIINQCNQPNVCIWKKHLIRSGARESGWK